MTDETHEPICASCGEPWPCMDKRLDWETRRILEAEANLCRRCKKRIGWYKITVPEGGDFGEDAIYHGRKGACRDFAMRELRRLGHDDLVARVLRTEAARAEWAARRRTA